jgi:hypothetical protein
MPKKSASEIAAENLEKDLTSKYPTPKIVAELIEKEFIAAPSLSRIVTQLAYYAFRDTSDKERTVKAFSDLIHFCEMAEDQVKEGLTAIGILNGLAEDLVDTATKREANPFAGVN